jgi:hypothetical protein
MEEATPEGANTYAPVGATPGAENLLINEVLTNNVAGIVDEDGDHEGWVEIYNSGSTQIDLSGMRLTDGVSVWAFGEGETLGAGDYLIVFISGKNNQGAELATNFSIPVEGGTITLLDKNNPVFSELDSVDVPELGEDESWGRDPNDPNTFIVITEPTPGSINIAPNADAEHLVINEVVTSNKDSLIDSEGDAGDWIEIYNTSSTVDVSLKNILIGDSGNLWQFPNSDNIVIPAGGYLIIFQDGKDKIVDLGNGVYEVHTSFNLTSAG